MHKARSILGVLCFLMTFISLNGDDWANAQSTLFNIPSTDVVAEKKVYFEFDFVSHLERAQDGGFQTYVPRAVVGLGKGVEVGVNVAASDFGPAEPIEIQPNIKWQFYNNEEQGVAVAAGGILYVPVKDKQALTSTGTTDNFGLLYTVVSKKVKSTYGPRLHGGVYGLVGRTEGNGTRGGITAGYEQPLHSKVSFVTDWFSGKNRFGYVTPGLSFALPKNSYLWAGYSIGNQGRKNNALFVYYGITF